MTLLRQLVAGEWVQGAGVERLDLNPAGPQGHPVAEFREASRGQMDAAVDAAHQALPGWAATPMADRAKVLVGAAGYLDANAVAFGEDLTREEGKTVGEGIGEVRRAAEILRFAAGECYREEGALYPSPRRGESIQVVHRPVGVIGVITPWNFPIAIPAWKIAPALIHGNTVVWKPAILVPLLASRLAEALVMSGLPPGVLSLVYARGVDAEILVRHPLVDAVTFTGSTAVGTRLGALCGEALKPLQAELGGKNAAIVLGDADVELSADAIVRAAMASTGQKCTATSRVVVERSVAMELIEALRLKAGNLRVGDPLDPEVEMGPAVSAEAKEEILGHIRMAQEDDAVAVVGGVPYTRGPLREGFYVPPTVLSLPDTSPAVWRQEVFGPVLAVVVAADASAAFEMANDTVYGLSASVFTSDLGYVQRAIDECEVGVLHINSESTGADPHVPFGGIKRSGIGPKEQGRSSREFFTHTRTVYVRGIR